MEKCQCPEGYYGYSCEDCDIGYYRSQEGPLGPFCTKCDCSGHADTCHPETGECVNLIPPKIADQLIIPPDYCHFYPENCTRDDTEVNRILILSQCLKITHKKSHSIQQVFDGKLQRNLNEFRILKKSPEKFVKLKEN